MSGLATCSPRRPAAAIWAVARSSVSLAFKVDRRKVLSVRKQPNDVNVIRGDKVEPAARETRDSTDAKPRDAVELTDKWRTCARHLLDSAKGLKSGGEESRTKFLAADSAIVTGTLDEIDLCRLP